MKIKLIKFLVYSCNKPQVSNNKIIKKIKPVKRIGTKISNDAFSQVLMVSLRCFLLKILVFISELATQIIGNNINAAKPTAIKKINNNKIIV